MEQSVIEVSTVIGEREACNHFGISRGTFQRRRRSRVVEALIASTAADSLDRVLAELPRTTSRQVLRFLERKAAEVTRVSPRTLTAEQNQSLLDAVHQARFIDRSVPYIYATLLDEHLYYGSVSTTYRVLRSVGDVGERRDQATRPAHVKPELCATEPNRVHAWDITKLPGPAEMDLLRSLHRDRHL